MKILLSVDTVRAPLTGIGRYVYELARHLPLEPDVEAVYLYDTVRGLLCYDTLTQLAERAPASAAERYGRRIARIASRLGNRISSRLSVPLWRRQLPDTIDLVAHGPAFMLPPGEVNRVVTIADLSVIKYPQFHPTLRVKVVSREIEEAICKADHLLTFSAFTRRELVDILHYPPERVTAVPLAADSNFKPRGADAVAETLKRYGLSWRGYCLSVGTIEPRKQVDVLIDAFTLLKPDLQRKWPLALIGDPGWLSDKTHQRIKDLEASGRAHYLGYVPQGDLPFLYNGAAACLYTSIYEGFGLPAVEAMASGIPLIATAAASLPEVCGDGAILVEPGNSDALARALTQVLTDHDHACELAHRGHTVASRFSWERTAKETTRVYRQILGH